MAFKTIQNLPIEILVAIFKNLDCEDLYSCSETCVEWEKTLFDVFFKPQLKNIAEYDKLTKIILQRKGWTNNSNDKKLIKFLHKKYLP